MCLSTVALYSTMIITILLDVYLGPPLEPELEDVVVPAALDDLVAGVVADVVDLVRLEQVVRGHLVAVDQETLENETVRELLNHNPVKFLVVLSSGHHC